MRMKTPCRKNFVCTSIIESESYDKHQLREHIAGPLMISIPIYHHLHIPYYLIDYLNKVNDFTLNGYFEKLHFNFTCHLLVCYFIIVSKICKKRFNTTHIVLLFEV